MGYYTSYTLKHDSDNESLIANFREVCEEAAYALNDEGYTEEPCKWYDSDKDLMSFSKSHPEVLFTLEGDGEESGDIWKTYVKNGKSQTARVRLVFDEYDESKMS